MEQLRQQELEMLREVELRERRERVDALFRHMMVCIKFKRVIRRMSNQIRMRMSNVSQERNRPPKTKSIVSTAQPNTALKKSLNVSVDNVI